jgi:hypothetical protein
MRPIRFDAMAVWLTSNGQDRHRLYTNGSSQSAVDMSRPA